MTINPTDPATITPQAPIYNPMMPIGDNETPDDTPLPPLQNTNAFASIDKQFTALIKELTQQLSSLEKQLMQALRQISTPSAPPRPAPHAKKPPNSGPSYQRYGSMIEDAARRHDVDPLLVNAVINQESGFDPNAVSKAGAKGLMQLMPGTARTLGVHDVFDPSQNVEGGTALLRQLLDRYHGHVDLALAAYNAGPDAVDKYGGVPPFPETQAYVNNIMTSYRESALSA